jgi:hypothetical protein
MAYTAAKKPPYVIRSTDQVEGELNLPIANPQDLAQYPPHFSAMTHRLLDAFVDQPFESRHTVSETYAPARKAVEVLAHAVFEPEEIQKMTLELLGCRLVTRANSAPMPHFETPVGAHSFRVDANISWDGVHVETGLDVPCHPARGETPLNSGSIR